nr:group II intron reverse transcriptase/maturase [Rhodomonas sp. NIES-1730]
MSLEKVGKPNHFPSWQRTGRKGGNSLSVHRNIFDNGAISMTVKTVTVLADEWRDLPWKKFQKNLYKLQHRIYKATKNGDTSSVKRLQSLLIGSKGAKLLALRHISLNRDKKILGINDIGSFYLKQCLELSEQIFHMKEWKHKKLSKVSLFKDFGEKKCVGISNIKYRAMQYLIKYALEPVYKALASDGSYDFRPAYSTWEVQNKIFQNLKSSSKGYKKSILKLHIENCLNKIDHKKLLFFILLPGSAKKFIRSSLKYGILNENDKSLIRMPQESVLSALLYNIALHGIEDLNNECTYRSEQQRKGVRYANNMLYIVDEKENWKVLLKKIDKFLFFRGLRISKVKTTFSSSQYGVDFLGWHFKVKAKNKKFVCYPSKDNLLSFKKKFKILLKDSRYKLLDRIKMAKAFYKNWCQYHHFCDMGQVKVQIWSLKRWAYFNITRNSNYRKEEAKKFIAFIFNSDVYKINRVPIVRDSNSIFDSDIIFRTAN